MLVARVVHDQVEDHPKAGGVGGLHQVVEVRLRAEPWIDRGVVADVVADVLAGRRVDGRQPDGIHAQPVRAQVAEVLDDPAQVTGPVAIGVREAARVDLVDDAATPPVVAERGPAGPGIRASSGSPIQPVAQSVGSLGQLRLLTPRPIDDRQPAPST